MLHLLNTIPFPPVILVAAYALDLILGDPERLTHPVRWIGRLAVFLEAAMRRSVAAPSRDKALGAAFAVIIVGTVYFVSFALLYLSRTFSYPLFLALSAYMVWTSISIKSLRSEALAVIKAFEAGGLVAARTRLSRIVGRDTGSLTREGVLRAVVETVSENTSDGVVAPLFYLAIGGPPLMMAYKAVNTLDSMVGYKNERYMNFGWFSARLDDFANYLPARAASVLLVTTSFILGYNWMGSLRTLLRDGRNHPSPNSGLPEAAVAGALGLRLGGTMSYAGAVCEKPHIGDPLTEVQTSSVESTIRMMHLAAFMMVALVFAFRVLLMFMI